MNGSSTAKRGEATPLRPDRTLGSALQVLAVAVLLAPPLVAANFITRYAVNVPVWDQWQFVPYLEPGGTGLSLGTLAAQHNEHRIFFPRLAMLALARVSSWDIRWEMWFAFLVLLLGAGALFLEHRQRFGRGFRSIWTFAPASWLLFTLRQSENYLWGWQLQVFMAATSLVLALILLERPGPWRLAGAILCGVVSSYSFAAGLGVWPAGLVLMLLANASPADRRRRSVVWLLAGAAVLAMYLHGYRGPSHHPSPVYVLSHPGLALHFFTAMIGASVTQPEDPASATAAGILLLGSILSVVAAAVTGRGRRGEMALGLALVTFAFAATALTTAGRSGFGLGAEHIGYALMSRYTTFTMLGVYGAYRCCLALRPRLVRATAAGGLAALMLLGALASFQTEFRSGADLRRSRRGLQAILVRHRAASDEELKALFIDVGLVRWAADVLEKQKLTIFSATPGG